MKDDSEEKKSQQPEDINSFQGRPVDGANEIDDSIVLDKSKWNPPLWPDGLPE